MRSSSTASWAALLLIVGCGSSTAEVRSAEDVSATEQGGRIEAYTELERQLLRELDELPTGSPKQLANEVVTAEAPYVAASGLRCRHVSWTQERRLACRDAEGWYFVPDVFGVAPGVP